MKEVDRVLIVAAHLDDESLGCGGAIAKYVSEGIKVAGLFFTDKAALDTYKDEMKAFPHARSIEAIESLARYRGSMVGLHMAEAFIIEREIV